MRKAACMTAYANSLICGASTGNGMSWRRMPHHNTYRRILAYKVYEQEVEWLVEEYNQQGEQGEVYVCAGREGQTGMRKKDEEGRAYGLSVYDVEQAKVLSQVEVGRKENEISKAPQAVKSVEISQKVITGDALHTQRALATQILEAQGDYGLPVKERQPQLYNNIQSLFPPISQAPLWQNPDRFPHRPQSEQRPRTD